jgi:hypothetical protein
LADQAHAQSFYKSALSDARHPSDAHTMRPACVRHQRCKDLAGLGLMSRQRGLNQGNGSGQQGALSGQYTVDELLGAGTLQSHELPLSSHDSSG